MFYGRKYELDLLEDHSKLGRAELVVLYGRRRIGKSEIIKRFIEGKNSLYFEAVENLSQKQQIDHFLVQLAGQLKTPKYDCKTWNEVFEIISGIIKEGKWIIAFDEFPWMASKRGALVSLLKFYWDQKWKTNPNVMLILCGSIASFMIEHIVHSRALHNRKTLEMHVGHLECPDVRAFLGNRSAWETAIVMMAVGGVPKYLEIFNSKLSAKINFNKQFFSKDGFFVNEFESIFKEQFRTTANYEAMVGLLSGGNFSFSEIAERTSFGSGGALKKYLRNLESAGFIEEWASVLPVGTKTKTRKYRLADPFLRIYFRFIEPNKKRIQLNTTGNLIDSIMGPTWDAFFGQSFDWFVYLNINRILKILSVPLADVIQYGPYFRQRSRSTNERGVQIDLMVIRNDNVVSVFENKFTSEPIGAYIQDEVQMKVDQLDFPKNFTIERVLISASGVTRAVSDGGYFNKIITLEEFFG